jgi:poly(hydroxyalkanoate) depolymerase family esterase
MKTLFPSWRARVRPTVGAVRAPLDVRRVIEHSLREAGLLRATPAAAADETIIEGEFRVVGDVAGTGDQRPATMPDASDAERFGAGRFDFDGHVHHYKLFVPSGFGARPLPLIVMLHGCTQDPDDFARGTRMNALAQARGARVLYPAQAPGSNPSRCWNWFQPGDQQRGAGEPAWLSALTRHVIAHHPVDPRRVHVAGLSAGGAMAAILGQEYPDLFASIGVHSGLAPGAARDVASAFAAMRRAPAATCGPASTPAIVFHGDEDRTVDPRNGEALLGTAGTRTRASGESGRRYTRTVVTDPAGRVRAEHWLVHGAGHAWSGGSAEGSYTDARGPDASREMLRFFDEHPRA